MSLLNSLLQIYYTYIHTHSPSHTQSAHPDGSTHPELWRHTFRCDEALDVTVRLFLIHQVNSCTAWQTFKDSPNFCLHSYFFKLSQTNVNRSWPLPLPLAVMITSNSCWWPLQGLIPRSVESLFSHYSVLRVFTFGCRWAKHWISNSQAT